MTSTEMNSFFTILLYASIFPCTREIGIWNRFIFYVVMLKKAFKDFGCKLFTIVMQDFLGLSINHNPLKAKILDRRCEILAEAKWKNALRTNHYSNDGEETNNMT